MTIGRRIVLGWPLVLWGEKRAAERLEGRWTARQPAARQKGRNAALLGFGFTKEGTFRIEEVSRVGVPVVYAGSYEVTGAGELVLRVSEAPEEGGRYRAEEVVNLGGILFLSESRVRVGEFELVKRLD